MNDKSIIHPKFEGTLILISGLHGLGKCLAFGEPMRLADGSIVPAESLIAKQFEVVAFDDNLKPVTSGAKAFDNGIQDVVEITTDKGRVIKRTLNHPLWVDTTPYRWTPSPSVKRLRPSGSWIESKHISPGDAIAVYAGNGLPEYSITDEEIKLSAYLLGDGGLTSGVLFTQKEGVQLDEMHVICASIDCKLNQKNAINYRIVKRGARTGGARNGPDKSNAQVLLKEWGMLGCDSYEKKYPDFVWRLSDRQLRLFLSRLFSTDGWAHCSIRKDGRHCREIGFCVVGHQLAKDTQSALLRLGIQAELRKKKTVCVGADKSRVYGTAYVVALHDTLNIIEFCDTVGIYGKEKAVDALYQDCLSANVHYTQKWRAFNLPEYMIWERVKTVKLIKDVQTVGITVEKYHTFATDFVEHNTTLAATMENPALTGMIDFDLKGRALATDLKMAWYNCPEGNSPDDYDVKTLADWFFMTLTKIPDGLTHLIIDNATWAEAGLGYRVLQNPAKYGVNAKNAQAGVYGGVNPGITVLWSSIFTFLQNKGIKVVTVINHMSQPWIDGKPAPNKFNVKGNKVFNQIASLAIILTPANPARGGKPPIPSGLVIKEALSLTRWNDETEEFSTVKAIPARIPVCTWKKITGYFDKPADFGKPAVGEEWTKEEVNSYSEWLSPEQIQWVMQVKSYSEEDSGEGSVESEEKVRSTLHTTHSTSLPSPGNTWLPAKVEFFASVRDNLGITVDEAAVILKKVPEFTPFNPEKATEMYQAIEKEVKGRKVTKSLEGKNGTPIAA